MGHLHKRGNLQLQPRSAARIDARWLCLVSQSTYSVCITFGTTQLEACHFSAPQWAPCTWSPQGRFRAAIKHIPDVCDAAGC